MTKREKHDADRNAWISQLKLAQDAYLGCMASMGLNDKWLIDCRVELDSITSHAIMLAQVRAEGEIQ